MTSPPFFVCGSTVKSSRAVQGSVQFEMLMDYYYDYTSKACCLVSEWNIFYRAPFERREALKASHNNRASIRVPSHIAPRVYMPSAVTMRKKAILLAKVRILFCLPFSKLQLMTRGCTLCD